MSIWFRILDAIAALRAGESLSAVFDRLRSEPEQRVGFAIAVIALGAKMAKADGQVTRDEVTAFREVFDISSEDEAAAGRVFNLARQDVAGFEDYAKRVKSMYGDNCTPLLDLLDGLFHIAMADGEYHPNEDAFLHRVAEIFEISDRKFRIIRARFVPDAERDPYDILGVDPNMAIEDIKMAYKGLVRETHPDKMIARGVPQEAVQMATRRLAEINGAWDDIALERAS
ncbi:MULTISPECIES: TerB family tellurite resistance protein [Pacificibacter]|uniref:TerB family tellurite resistance protein n=1 Tax=Pacificibacter TaxID=1042323 RepID=UPI001C091F20|nr:MULTISPECIES: TerB family tellurite resistance protein [Pacificibacter]MBU2937459.1 molecular chaperone DjiA [Pacificibacter marinus]MDO6615639.1 TerB family tellurite resistance protein [Pacificibacter sp. 1_MG-2023]